MLTNPVVVIILQCIHVSHQGIVHLKLTQCYMSIIYKDGGKKDELWKEKKLDLEVTVF